jgi:uroporphyrin-III C-methyltransferase
LRQAGWPDETAVSIVSRAGWPDALHTTHTVATLAQGSVLHAGRPTIVTVGAGAASHGISTFRANGLPGETLNALKSVVSPAGDVSTPTTKQEP